MRKRREMRTLDLKPRRHSSSRKAEKRAHYAACSAERRHNDSYDARISPTRGTAGRPPEMPSAGVSSSAASIAA